MLLRLTTVHEQDGHTSDLEVTCSEGETLSGLLASGAAGRCTPATCPAGTWWADGQRLDGGSPLGRPPLVHGVVLTHHCPPLPADPPREQPPLLEVHVVEGPDCGDVHPLPLGEHRVGRSGGTIRIKDLQLSRAHCAIAVTHEAVMVTDLGSTNGSTLDGHGLVTAPTEWRPGQRLRVGGTTLLLRVPRQPRAQLAPDGAGHLRYHRGPRRTSPSRSPTLGMPSAPEAAPPPRLPLAMIVLPLAVSGVLAAVTHSTTMLLFGLLGPVMLLSSWVTDRRRGRASAGRRRREHADALARFHEQREEALRWELRQRRASASDAAELAAQVRQRGTRVWERRPGDEDFLRLRVGTGPVEASVAITESAAPTSSSDSCTHPVLPEAPVTLDLAQSGPVGLAGPREQVVRCAQHLLGQVAGWHSPVDVAVVVLSATRERAADWAWSAWLPHLLPQPERGGAEDCPTLPALDDGDGGAALRRRAEILRESLPAPERVRPPSAPVERQRCTVVVLDGARLLRSVPGIPELLGRDPGAGLCFLAIEDEAQGLPVETEVSVVLTDEGGTGRLERRHAETPQRFTPDLVADGWADQLGRSLAPLRDATPRGSQRALPSEVRLVDVLGWDAFSPKGIARRWVAAPRSTAAVVGVSTDGPHALDLGRDGPHALLAGTTGAGKSELLQTLVASLALANRPDELCFVLVDYKGGSAFAACAQLPHTVGLVTDLDEHLAGRALTSLEAELKRRERILHRAGASDLTDYQKRWAALNYSDHDDGAEPEPLPRLVIVIDEFRVLADEQPAFLDGLVRIAAVGRSLGVHLVLATQRPAGVVSADIKANVNLRIALRVRDRLDSEDVVEAPDAAALPDDCPGRAVVRVAAEPLRIFQAARVGGGPPAREHTPLTVRPMGRGRTERSARGQTALTQPTQSGSTASEPADGQTDLARLVAAVQAASDELEVTAVPPPWLPPLPSILPLPDEPAGAPLSIPYAVADLPRAQSRRPVVWDLAGGGHLAVVGAPRSGRTTVVRTIAGAFARQLSPAEAHLFVFDAGASLSVLTELPHCGAVVGRDEVARGRRLIRRLAEELARRRRLLAAEGHGSLEEQRRAAARHGAPGNPPLPYLVLLLDGWEAFAETYERVDRGAVVEELLRLLREGPAEGLRVLLTGGRSLLAPRLGSCVAEKVCLRMGDETELLLAGVPREAVPASMPPGRGLRLDDAVELQVCLLGTDPSAAGQGEWIRRLVPGRALGEGAPAGPMRVGAPAGPLRVDPLPPRVTTRELRTPPAPARGGTSSPARASVDTGGVPLGLDGESLAPVLLGLPSTGLAFLVAGGPGSGRSTALATLAEGLTASGRTVLHLAATGHDTLADRLTACPDADVLVDDVGGLLDRPGEQLLLDVLARQRSTGAVLAVAADPDDLAHRYRGLAAELRRTRTGLLLCPDSREAGELLGIPAVPVDDERVPGRGLLVLRGRATPVQVALPTGDVPLPP